MQWTVNVRGPPPWYKTAVIVGHHKVFSFGGRSNEDLERRMNVYIFNLVSLRWRTLPPAVTPGRGQLPLEVPCWRFGHKAVLVGNIAYIWGGYSYHHDDEEHSNVLYAFDVDAHTWSKPRVSGTIPKVRYGHSACVLGNVMFIYGGVWETECTNGMSKLDTTTMVWCLINTRGTPPSATERHSGTIIGTKMFVFGGKGDQWMKATSDPIRVFDTETNQWMNTPSTQPLPENRWAHSAFSSNGQLYIFGGYKSHPFNDLWKYNPETFSWKEVKPKGMGPSSIMTDNCCCIVGDRVILFCRDGDELFILDLSPSLETLCKLAVIQYGLDQSELPHHIGWELAAMMNKYRFKYGLNRWPPRL